MVVEDPTHPPHANCSPETIQPLMLAGYRTWIETADSSERICSLQESKGRTENGPSSRVLMASMLVGGEYNLNTLKPDETPLRPSLTEALNQTN